MKPRFNASLRANNRALIVGITFSALSCAQLSLAQQRGTDDADPVHQQSTPSAQGHSQHDNQDVPESNNEHRDASHPSSEPVSSGAEMGGMNMGSMSGGRATIDTRDPYAYSDGYEYSTIPGRETSDEIVFGWVSGEELEYLSGNEGDGVAWNVQANFGNDANKLWLRTQGLKVPGELDPTTDVEALWWRPYASFWGTQLGIRQDLGEGAHTYLAFGIEGLTPYWFLVEATGYIGDDGRLSARLKVSYDMRLTNRLILTSNLESNSSSKAEDDRNLGSGLGNIEVGLRARYEVRRKFAPYVGYVWERSFAGTAERRQAAGDPVNEHRFVAGFRVWF